MNATWYLLFEGSSCDGTGEPTYVSRTTDYNKAKEFLAKNADSPYHFDKVIAITDFEYRQFRSVRDLDFWLGVPRIRKIS